MKGDFKNTLLANKSPSTLPLEISFKQLVWRENEHRPVFALRRCISDKRHLYVLIHSQ